MDAPAQCLCRDGGAVAFVDPVTHVGYCISCSMDPIKSSQNVNLQYLDDLLQQQPVALGERVECRTEGIDYDGDGEVIRISEEVRHGGTPVHPAYLVRLDDGREWWYTSICLTRTTKESA